MTIENISSIMLIGAENHVALPVIRALGSALPGHISIITLSTEARGIQSPLFSRYVGAHFLLQSTNDEELIQELITRIEETGATILLPLNERYVRLLSQYQQKLSNYIHLPPLPDITVFDGLVNKNKLGELLQEHLFPCAITHSLTNGKLNQLEEKFYPCMLKPIRGSSGKGIRKIDCYSTLNNSLTGLDTDNYILQEYIPGKDIDCSLFAINGEIKAITIQEGMESEGFNFSTAVKFVKNKAVLDSAEKLIKITGYSGLAHLDYRFDERDGQPKLIDFNARFWLSLLASKAAGVNFALLYCFAAIGIPFDKPNVKEITYLMGKSTFRHYYKRTFRSHSSLFSNSTHTDLWGRMRDPLPEIAKYLHLH